MENETIDTLDKAIECLKNGGCVAISRQEPSPEHAKIINTLMEICDSPLIRSDFIDTGTIIVFKPDEFLMSAANGFGGFFDAKT